MSLLTARSGAGNILSRAASRVSGSTVTSSSGQTYVSGQRVSVGGGSMGAYSSGSSSSGRGSVPTKYSVAVLDAVKVSAQTGKPVVIPKFPNTPAGVVERSNFVQELSRLKLDGVGNKALSSTDLLSRKYATESTTTQGIVDRATSLVSKYQAEGKSLQSEADKLQADASSVDVYSQESVNAYNARVSAFTTKINAYEARGVGVQSEANKAQTSVAQLNTLGEQVTKVSRLQRGGTVAPLINDNTVSGSYVPGVVAPLDTRSPAPVSFPASSVGGRDVRSTILTTKTKTPLKSDFTGEPVRKIKVETAGSLMSKGALGTAFKEEAMSTPITDFGSGIKNIGLTIASIPAEAGQLVGSSIAKNLGLKTAFKENEEFIFKSQSGKTKMAEIYDPKRALVETQKSFGKDPFGTSIDIGFKAITLFPMGASFAASKLISKSKLLQSGVRGIEGVASKGESLIARSIYSGKKLLIDQTSVKVALKSSKGVTMGTLRTDVVSKLIGRKTIKLSDITTKDIARAFGEKGKAQYLKFPKSEQELFKRASVGEQAKFIKKTFAKYKIAPDDVIGFSAESGKATGLIEAFTKKGKVSFKFVGSEPYGKFFASRTATGPFANLGSYDDIKVTFTNIKVPKPSVTVGIGQRGILPTKGGIKGSVKALGFDVKKTSPQLQAYFDDALKAGARPPKLKELRIKFGEADVAKGYITSPVKLAGKFVSSPSRVFRLTGEEEFVAPFLTRTKLLGGLKERYFGSAIVKVGGKRVKLNIKKLIPETESSISTGKVTASISKGTKGVSSSITRGGPNIKYINITPSISAGAGLASSFITSKINTSLSSAITSVSIPSLTSSVPSLKISISSPVKSVSSISVPKVSSSSPKISTSISSATTSVSIPKISTSISKSTVSTSVPKISTSISSVSTPVSSTSVPRISTSISKVSTSVPKISVSTPRVSIISTSVPSVLGRITTPGITIPGRLTGGGSSVPVKGISKSYPKISTSISKRVSSKKYSLSPGRTRIPRITKSISRGYKTPRYDYSPGQPKFKQKRIDTSNNWNTKGLYREKSAFKDIKGLKNRTTGFGFNTRNDFSISNVFKGSDVMKSKANLKRSSYSVMSKRANKYKYKNQYDVSFKSKGFPSYKYSSKLVDKGMFDMKVNLTA